MQPRPVDLAALVRVLPPGAVALTFDLETCAAPGGDARVPGRLRIVQLALLAFSADMLPDGEPVQLPQTAPDEAPAIAGYIAAADTFVNPRCRIDGGSQQKHHITDAQVCGAPAIEDCADTLIEWLQPADRPVYLVGYNLRKYDVPALAAELRRVGRGEVADLLESLPVLDVMLIRREAEPSFTLEGSVVRYGLPPMTDAHQASADCSATLAVLAAQAACGHLARIDEALALGTATRAPQQGAVDSQGKLKWVGGTAPTPPAPTPDNVMIDFGKNRGLTLRQAGAGFAKWVVGKDFDDDVKAALRQAFAPASTRW